MKRQILLSLTALLSALPALAENFLFEYEGQTLQYTVLDEEAKTCEVSQNRDIEGDIKIPVEANGYSVTALGYRTFYDCRALTSVEIPNSVTAIGDMAFCQSGLISIKLSESLVTIGKSAFEDCRSLISIDIPNSVTNIGNYSFSFCASLKSINVGDGNNSFSSINGVLFNKDITEIICYPSGIDDIDTYSIPGTVTSIGSTAFHYCRYLTSIIIPNSITTIGELAFGYCTRLSSVEIPNSVTTINQEAFYGCNSLISIDIPNSVTYIGNDAFDYCRNLTELTCRATIPPHGARYIMSNYDKVTLYVPKESIEAYKSHEAWGKFANIEAIDDSNAIEETEVHSCIIEVIDGALVVKGSEEVRVYNAAGSEVYSGSAGRIELPGGIYVVATHSLTKKVKI